MWWFSPPQEAAKNRYLRKAVGLIDHAFYKGFLMTLISCWDRWITSSAFIETLFPVQIYSRDSETYRTFELALTSFLLCMFNKISNKDPNN